MIREELARLCRYEERHRRLLARMVLALGLSLVAFTIGTALVWLTESGQKGGDIHGVGDAAFFTAAQLLTVSSSMPNPVTPGGQVVDVALELWAVFVITAVAGSFATFFSTGDSSSDRH
jgi:glucose uptake protein GlcU